MLRSSKFFQLLILIKPLSSASAASFNAFALALLFLCFSNDSWGQIHAGRFLNYSIESSDSAQFGLLSNFRAAMHLDRAIVNVSPELDETEEEELSEFPSRDRAWNIFFGQSIDLYRWSSFGSVSFQAHQEITANERNDISFNPRSISWEEELIVRGLASIYGTYTSLSVFHRCKHDVDNSDQEQRDKIVPGLIQKRSLILSGVAIQQSTGPDFIFSGRSDWRCNAELRAETYLIHHDYRYPLVTFGYSWTQAKAAIMGTANVEYTLSKTSSLSLRTHLSEMFFGEGAGRPAAQGLIARSELQYTITGKSARLRLSIVNERLFDEVVRISADATNTWSFGIGFFPLGTW